MPIFTNAMRPPMTTTGNNIPCPTAKHEKTLGAFYFPCCLYSGNSHAAKDSTVVGRKIEETMKPPKFHRLYFFLPPKKTLLCGEEREKFLRLCKPDKEGKNHVLFDFRLSHSRSRLVFPCFCREEPLGAFDSRFLPAKFFPRQTNKAGSEEWNEKGRKPMEKKTSESGTLFAA